MEDCQIWDNTMSLPETKYQQPVTKNNNLQGTSISSSIFTFEDIFRALALISMNIFTLIKIWSSEQWKRKDSQWKTSGFINLISVGCAGINAVKDKAL